MTSTFDCPSCGAPLDYPGSGDTMHCPFCNNSVIVPAELRHPIMQPDPASRVGTATIDSYMQTADQVKEIVRLMQSGNEIEAIKIYRQITGVGLVEAKAAVEAIQSGSPVQLAPAQNSAQTAYSMGGLTPDQTAMILQLVSSGQKIEAIKRYRSLTNVGLAQAKAAVESFGPNGQQAVPSEKKFSFLAFGLGLMFLGIASIFPLVFIPMGMASLQQNDVGGAIGSFIGAGVWALVWGAIGIFLMYWSIAK